MGASIPQKRHDCGKIILAFCGKMEQCLIMHSIEIFEANIGTRKQDEAAAIVLTRAQKYVNEPRALELISYWIEDLMRSSIAEPRRGGL
jgi:hypothetical protein